MKQVYFLFFLFFIFSCGKNDSDTSKSFANTSNNSIEDVVDFSSKVIEQQSYSLSEYHDWLLKQKGVTFDEQENKLFKINILYKPLNYEAALLMDFNSENVKEEYLQYISIKKDYHYFVIECLQKNISASELYQNKRDFLEVLKRNISIITGESNQIKDFHVEVFPSSLINQPSQLLILVPADKSNTRLRATITGSPFSLDDIQLDISEEQFESFPELKL